MVSVRMRQAWFVKTHSLEYQKRKRSCIWNVAFYGQRLAAVVHKSSGSLATTGCVRLGECSRRDGDKTSELLDATLDFRYLLHPCRLPLPTSPAAEAQPTLDFQPLIRGTVHGRDESHWLF